MKFLLHALIFLWYIGTTVAISCKELSYHLRIAMFLFIQIHLIAPAQAKDAKSSMVIIQPYLRQYIILQVVMQWVMAG